MATTRDEIVIQNQQFCDMMESNSMRKQAEDDASDYIRYKLREEGFARKILPPVEVGNDIDQSLYTDKPIKYYQKETDVPWSVTVGYGAVPNNFYIFPSKFAVSPTMIQTPQVQKNKWELRTYKYDVKQVFADNMVKDLQAEEDSALLSTVNTLLVGPDSEMPASGVAQYKRISGGFSRESTVTACFQVMNQTMFNIPVETVLINNITWSEHMKWRRDEAGGDISEKMLTQGWSQSNLWGLRWLITIKRGLVGNNTQYMFGPTKFLGKSCLFTPPTMYIKTENINMYMFQAAEEIGSTIAHTGAIGRVDYQNA